MGRSQRRSCVGCQARASGKPEVHMELETRLERQLDGANWFHMCSSRGRVGGRPGHSDQIRRRQGKCVDTRMDVDFNSRSFRVLLTHPQ